MENEKDDKFITLTNGSKIEIPQTVDMTVVRGGRATEYKAWWKLLEDIEDYFQ